MIVLIWRLLLPLLHLRSYQYLLVPSWKIPKSITHTRPDLSYVILCLSQYMQSLCVGHFNAGLRVLRYLKSNLGQGLFLNASSSMSLIAFCGADWASRKDFRWSVSGFFISLGGSPISWKFKKQASISLSSAESEYRSMRRVTAELTWLTRLLHDLSVLPTLLVPLFFDSKASIYIARNPVFHERTKHVKLDCHFVRQQFLYPLSLLRSSLLISLLNPSQDLLTI